VSRSSGADGVWGGESCSVHFAVLFCIFSLSVLLLLLFPLFAVLLNCLYPDPRVFCLFLSVLFRTTWPFFCQPWATTVSVRVKALHLGCWPCHLHRGTPLVSLGVFHRSHVLIDWVRLCLAISSPAIGMSEENTTCALDSLTSCPKALKSLLITFGLHPATSSPPTWKNSNANQPHSPLSGLFMHSV